MRAVAAAAGCVLMLAACTSTKGGQGTTQSASAPTTTHAASPTPSSSAPATTGGAGGGSGGGSGGSTTSGGHGGGAGGGTGGVVPAACAGPAISVTAGPLPQGSGAGHTGVLLTFTNVSARACSLHGYPGVAGLDTTGKQLAQATRTLNGYLAGCRCTTPPTVTIGPLGVASATVEGSIGSGNCDRFAGMLVTPPNTATSTQVATAPHSCDFTVHPVVAGATGSGK